MLQDLACHKHRLVLHSQVAIGGSMLQDLACHKNRLVPQAGLQFKLGMEGVCEGSAQHVQARRP